MRLAPVRLDEVPPAGDYSVETEEELVVDGISYVACWRRALPEYKPSLSEAGVWPQNTHIDDEVLPPIMAARFAFTNPPFGVKTMKSTSLIALIAFLSLSLFILSACGSSKSDRALSGGGIGAGVGLVGGALVGAPLTGAAVGGAVGAGTGALTDEDDVDLGKPFWRD